MSLDSVYKTRYTFEDHRLLVASFLPMTALQMRTNEIVTTTLYPSPTSSPSSPSTQHHRDIPVSSIVGGTIAGASVAVIVCGELTPGHFRQSAMMLRQNNRSAMDLVGQED